MSSASIVDLAELVAALPEAERGLFERLIRVSVSVGELVPPAAMAPWIERLFGSVEVTRRQKIIKTTNLVTYEGALFNELRARRPIEVKVNDDLEAEVERHIGDPFCHPLDGTPADIFGRVRGQHCLTASNIAKYDSHHGVIVFDEHNPFEFTRDKVGDYIEAGSRWAQAAHAHDPSARYYFFMWNCLWKSGASVIHGHAQVSLSHDSHYAKIEFLRQAALAYRAHTGRDYFDDWYRAHALVGCGVERGPIRWLASLTPIKEKEIVILAPQLDSALIDAVHAALDCYRRDLGVSAFNLVLCLPPLGPTPEDWVGFPAIARLVDRGDPLNRTSDMGAMELYASSVIASDPLRVADALRAALLNGHSGEPAGRS